MSSPHYLRFARALALVGGLAGCASTAPTESAEPVAEDDTAGDEQLDGTGTTSGDTASSNGLNGCSCYGTPMGPGECDGSSTCDDCCARGAVMVGPLSPPDLPA